MDGLVPSSATEYKVLWQIVGSVAMHAWCESAEPPH